MLEQVSFPFSKKKLSVDSYQGKIEKEGVFSLEGIIILGIAFLFGGLGLFWYHQKVKELEKIENVKRQKMFDNVYTMFKPIF
jgi:uncharacterized protein (DUF2164 family)